MSQRIVLFGWTALLLILLAGCRSETDRQIDTLVASGITVIRNPSGVVIGIDTAGATLDEHFWQSLRSFEQLRHLMLTGSPVTDADLPQVTSLSRLESLDLSYTQISPTGLRILSRMNDLQTLSLNGVPLNHDAVDPLCRLTRLRSLSVMETNLKTDQVQKIQKALSGCLVVE